MYIPNFIEIRQTIRGQTYLLTDGHFPS